MSLDILLNEVIGGVNDRQRELLAASKADCDRLTKLVKELLDLSKLESGKHIIERGPVSVLELIDHASRSLRLLMTQKHITLKMRMDPKIPTVSGDMEKLTWVLTNLVNNAVQHTDFGGSISISARYADDIVQISVADSGQGIPPEELERVFERFVQLKGKNATSPGSVGLGLSIAREVVLQHGGRIWAESEPGKGSRFTFTLPLQRDSRNG
jgi:two-component system, NtrC family, sensor histidine kinase KinB